MTDERAILGDVYIVEHRNPLNHTLASRALSKEDADDLIAALEWWGLDIVAVHVYSHKETLYDYH